MAGERPVEKINVLNGLRYTPEQFLARMNRSKKMRGIHVRQVNTLYSLCWIFQLRISVKVTKKKSRYAGYYAGFDESVMTPGKLAVLPSYETREVFAEQIIEDRLTEEEALRRTWEYNRTGVIRKYRILSAVPQIEDYVPERCYKPMYLFEFHHLVRDEKKYMVLDSLTGDLEPVAVE